MTTMLLYFVSYISLGDMRRRLLREKAAEDIANAPEDPSLSRAEAKELGRLTFCRNSLKHNTQATLPKTNKQNKQEHSSFCRLQVSERNHLKLAAF